MYDALPTRRSLLASGAVVAATGLAGCSSLFGGGTTELVVHNERDDAVEVMVTVTNPNRAEPLLDSEVVSVDAGGRQVVSEDLPRLKNHLVTVDVRDDAPAESFRAAKATAALHVYVDTDGMEFVVGARN